MHATHSRTASTAPKSTHSTYEGGVGDGGGEGARGKVLGVHALKIREKIFFEKIFSGNYHVKFRNFVSFGANI